jgi:hypothetical protein
LIDSGVDPVFAEMMMSHTSKIHPSMPTYTRRTTRLFDEYKKAILNLTIDDSERLKIENKIKDKRIDKLESEKDAKIAQLERDMVYVKKLLSQAKSD